MTTTFDQAVHKIEAFAEDEFEKLKAAVTAELVAVAPQAVALGRTIAGQVWQAALTYILSGGPMNPGAAGIAVASVTAQLPADLVASEHLVMALFAGAVQNLQAKQAAGQPVQ